MAAPLGIDEVHAGLLPQEKVAAVQALREAHGAVAMVGDGVNDAPALAAADVGIAMGAIGSDAALETADVALMTDELPKIAYAIRLSRATVRNIRANIAISLVLKAAFLALAVGGVATLWMAVDRRHRHLAHRRRQRDAAVAAGLEVPRRLGGLRRAPGWPRPYDLRGWKKCRVDEVVDGALIRRLDRVELQAHADARDRSSAPLASASISFFAPGKPESQARLGVRFERARGPDRDAAAAEVQRQGGGDGVAEAIGDRECRARRAGCRGG